MSWHRPEKHLAVLVSVVEQGLSVREAAATHGVAKGSVELWVKRHRSGQQTLESLRAAGLVPTDPVWSYTMAHGPERLSAKDVILDPLTEATSVVVRQRFVRERLGQERLALVERLAAIDEALKALDAGP